MKIAIIGSRGIPARYGGFETFADEISGLLASDGHDVIVQCEPSDRKQENYKGVTLFHSSVEKSGHTMRYYLEGIMMGLKDSEVIIATGVGAAVFYFLNFFKKRLLITITDGIEYRRTKWSFLKRYFLKLSEVIAVKFSDVLIADSKAISNYLMKRYSVHPDKISVIEYGARPNEPVEVSLIEKYRLLPRQYYMTVCRLEPENNLKMILEGHKLSGSVNPILVVGTLQETNYVKSLIREFNSGNVIFAGGIYDKKELSTLRYFCKAYIHGHMVGGTNPSLLEAMAGRNLVICHKNEFNLEVTDGKQLYFSNIYDCASAIGAVDNMDEEEADKYREYSFRRIQDYYRWDLIIIKYRQLLEKYETKTEQA